MTSVDPRIRQLEIVRLGHEGDGIGSLDGEAAFVPFAAPGDVVTVEIDKDRGRIIDVIVPGADRAEPICRHYGTCGGCAMQHIRADAYTAWKTGIVAGALARAGIEASLRPLVAAPQSSRRRAIMGAKRSGQGIVLGFHEPRGHRIIEMAECPVLSPAIVECLPQLREIADAVLPRFSARGPGTSADGLRLIATQCDNGLDVVVEGAGKSLAPAVREKIAKAARDGRLLRVSLDRDPVYVTAQPLIRFGTANVTPPPGAFLQAVPEIERAMADQIVEALTQKRPGRKPARRVADLYCGVGTFTFPIAARAEILAIDSDKRAIEALAAATRLTPGLRPVTALVRDLHRDPLSARELDAFDAVVFDPPRAGAAAQAERLAKSKVATIVAVSCAPGTLARDLAILCAGGYAIEQITPYDQFLYTPHVETVAVLRRA